MTGEVFAAIDVGSYEISLKIFELSMKYGVRELDHVRHRMDIGSETYATGRISSYHVDEMIRILSEYKKIMKEYGVTHYQAYGTSAIRETKDIAIVRDLIENRTGIHIDVLSNSEQRFIDYKSIALKYDQFEEVISRPTAIVDIGGGSIQISLFEKDALFATNEESIRYAAVRIGGYCEKHGITELTCLSSRSSELVEKAVQELGKELKKEKVTLLSSERVATDSKALSRLLSAKYGLFLEELHGGNRRKLRELKQFCEENEVCVVGSVGVTELTLG